MATVFASVLDSLPTSVICTVGLGIYIRSIFLSQIEDVAIRCIQRNVRKFMSVRDWQWWRLLVRITPLLNVHRTEQELKSKTVSYSSKLSLVLNFLCTYEAILDTQTDYRAFRACCSLYFSPRLSRFSWNICRSLHKYEYNEYAYHSLKYMGTSARPIYKNWQT